MATFISAGHHLKDSGAVANGRKENLEAIRLRGLVVCELFKYNIKVYNDHDTESLSQYLARIQPGNASVVVEIHFNASSNPKSTGSEVLIADKHTSLSKEFAAELSKVISDTLGIVNRGVKTESQSARGKLAFVRKQGCTALIEVCFISNPDDMKKYDDNINTLAASVAKVIAKYDNMIK